MGVVLNEDELTGRIAGDRRAGLRIAFANGCFDVLHVGHIRYLRGAKAEADRLIVAINDDDSVRRLKGPSRPILPAEARAELVAALEAVDYVVRFSDDTVERLLRRFTPDVHCKGTDYTAETVPERDVVRGYGGRIAIVGDPKDHSTRSLIDGLRRSQSTTRLLVVRLGSLGDLVHTLPAVAALRRANPGAEIDWLTDAAHEEFLRLVPVVSNVIPLANRTARAWLRARRTLRDRRYDVALDFQGLLKSAALARLSGARRVIGFDRAALREGAASPFYTEHVEVGERGHVIDKNLRLAAALGAAPAPVEFPIAPVESAASRALSARGLTEYALVNPGAAWPNKRWPPDRFGQVARHLSARHGLTSVVLWGPSERSLADAVVAASGGTAVAAPETSLADLVALSRGAACMISGDTGPLHIASAVGTPVVALFGPTSAPRNGPWRPDDVTLDQYGDCDCHYERRCRRSASAWCLGRLGVDPVTDAVDRRLAAARAGRRPS
jgi:lipopolysaccharide heptosyltransferase I